MRCEEARQLFDAYLDGELSPALATELGAHRLRCPDCRRALALLEVTGHIVASDQDPVLVSEGLTDRLLACMQKQETERWPNRVRRILYIGGPLAAAAVVCLAFLGMFDRDRGAALGEKDYAEPEVIQEILMEEIETEAAPDDTATDLDEWGQRIQQNLDSKRHGVESLQKYGDMTILQWLDALERAKDKSAAEDHFPGADPVAEPSESITPPLEGDRAEGS
jgi:hypothetical protein